MSKTESSSISLQEDRFARAHSIEWWDQEKLAAARVLIIGAGALGNEVIKNLALLGIGHIVIVDMDRVEISNLSRSVLFRISDRGLSKAECAARAAKELYPGLEAIPVTGNVLGDVGLGFFKWADVVVGALDNREARVFVNKACAVTGRPWLDGGIEVLNGVVRGFAPPVTACYECTMGKTDWENLDKRRSCSLLARRTELLGHVPTTATTASVIGAIQAQEVVKSIHEMDTLLGRGFVFEGESHNSYTVNYSIKPGCVWHEAPPQIEEMTGFDSGTPLREICDCGAKSLGGFDAVEFARDLVHNFTCPNCRTSHDVFQPVHNIGAAEAVCESCGTEYSPSFFHGISKDDELLEKTVGQIGLPGWDILWVRLRENYIGIEISGDNPFAGMDPAGIKKGG